jgi:hypothetical protein
MSVYHLTSAPKPLNMCVNNLHGNRSPKVVDEVEFRLKLDEYKESGWFNRYSDELSAGRPAFNSRISLKFYGF